MNRIALIDFEASALGPGSYPVEVAVGLPDLGELKIWLIRPHGGWLGHGVWNDEAERLHGLSRTRLLRFGEPAIQVARQVLERLAGRAILCENPAHDGYWLGRLLGTTGVPPRPVANVHELLREHVGQDAYDVAHDAAGGAIKPNHRAGTDVRFLMELYRNCAGYDPTLMPPVAGSQPAGRRFGRLLRLGNNRLPRAGEFITRSFGRAPGRV